MEQLLFVCFFASNILFYSYIMFEKGTAFSLLKLHLFQKQIGQEDRLRIDYI